MDNWHCSKHGQQLMRPLSFLPGSLNKTFDTVNINHQGKSVQLRSNLISGVPKIFDKRFILKTVPSCCPPSHVVWDFSSLLTYLQLEWAVRFDACEECGLVLSVKLSDFPLINLLKSCLFPVSPAGTLMLISVSLWFLLFPSRLQDPLSPAMAFWSTLTSSSISLGDKVYF